MRKAEIEVAIKQGTPLAWSRDLPREGRPWPRGGKRMLPLEVRAGGRVRCRTDDGDERVVVSRNLMTTWERYEATRARVDEENDRRRVEREALDARIEAAAAAIGGGAKSELGRVRAPGGYHLELTAGLWLPIETAELLVQALGERLPELMEPKGIDRG